MLEARGTLRNSQDIVHKGDESELPHSDLSFLVCG